MGVIYLKNFTKKAEWGGEMIQNVSEHNESKIITIFAIVSVFTVLLSNVISLYSINKIHKATEEIYQHPLRVSNAAIMVQKGVLKIHRDMKDIVLSTSDEELRTFVSKVDDEEKNVYVNLKIIKKNILGVEGLKLEAETYMLFKNWKNIRETVIQLMSEKKYEQAIKITKYRGADHVRKLEQSALVLYKYSHTKADTFQQKSHKTFTNFNIINIISTVLIIFFLFFMFYIRARIKQYLHVLRENETALNEANETFELFMNHTQTDVFITEDEVIVYANTNANDFFGDKNIVGLTLKELLPEAEVTKINYALDKSLEVGKFDTFFFTKNYKGEEKIYHQLFFAMDMKRKKVGLISIDVTKEKLQENELHKQEEIMIAQSRHAAMGEMISMIAHQWRQPISVIAMDANNILADIELDILEKEELLETSKDIISQTQELSKTIDDFREFFKPDKTVEDVSLRSIVDDAMSIVGKSLENNGVEVVIKLDEKIHLTTFSREVMQVLINILKNAKEAFLDVDQESQLINIESSLVGGNVRLTLCDNAGGIDLDFIDKIFNPYFTTKSEKNGTGLGLYMSKTIIEKHLHGSISVSNQNGGSCFTIVLPLRLEIDEVE